MTGDALRPGIDYEESVCCVCGVGGPLHDHPEQQYDDTDAMDDLAELFLLPEWQINGSGASFIQACADIVGRRRDLDGSESM